MSDNDMELPRGGHGDSGANLTGLRNSARRQMLVDCLKRDYAVCLLAVTPFVSQFQLDPQWLSRVTGLSVEEVEMWISTFVELGYWLKSADGSIRVSEAFLDMGELELSVFLTMASAIATRLSPTGDCAYEFLMIGTNTQLKREFNQGLRQLIRDFIRKSQNVEKTTIVAFTHAWVDSLAEEK